MTDNEQKSKIQNSKSKIYLGFGFGAIQAGLFLYEAWRSGNFDRLVVAEVMPTVVAAVRGNGGYYTLNIAQRDHVETVRVGPVEIFDPADPADRPQLIAAIAAAQELGTAVPSINFYANESPGSIHRLLAEGLRQKIATDAPRCAIYTAENNNHAAELLQEKVLALLAPDEQSAVLARACFVNTVIAKMCGVVPATADLPAIAPALERAFLVEAFRQIQISPIHFIDNCQLSIVNGQFQPGLTLFEPKADLLPFEETKLFALNGIHAISAYLAHRRGVTTIAQLGDQPDVLAFLRAAATEEIAPALAHQYASFDPFFRLENLQSYAFDYIARMTNPFLQDAVARVGRDPERKLAWADRLIGALRLIHTAGIAPRRYAYGAAAAINYWLPDQSSFPADQLCTLWREAPPAEAEAVLAVVATGWQQLQSGRELW